MLEDVKIIITSDIRVFHSLGFITITKNELLEILNNKGEIKIDKLSALYDYKYSPKWMLA